MATRAAGEMEERGRRGLEVDVGAERTKQSRRGAYMGDEEEEEGQIKMMRMKRGESERGTYDLDLEREMQRQKSPEGGRRRRDDDYEEDYRPKRGRYGYYDHDGGSRTRSEPRKPRKEGNPKVAGGGGGGVYIPPAKLRAMREAEGRKTDGEGEKDSIAIQRETWEVLKKGLNGLVNKVNIGNIQEVVPSFFELNLVRGRGILARSLMKSQAVSAGFTGVYAAVVAVINSKFPENGELLLQRLILQFRRAFNRNDKGACISSVRFIAHLVNQQVAHEVLALQLLHLLLNEPTDDSVEVAVGFLKECGCYLQEISPQGLNAVFERLRGILHEGDIDKRVQYMIEVMFAIRKNGFKDFQRFSDQKLDLVEEDDQITHLLSLTEEEYSAQEELNIFRPDPDYIENQEKYLQIKRELLGGDSSDSDSEDEQGDGEDEEEGEDEEDENEGSGDMNIIDKTNVDQADFRRRIYLTIMSSANYEECAHKLIKAKIDPSLVPEMCSMILECCMNERSYKRFYGLLAQRFCDLGEVYRSGFLDLFEERYMLAHRLDNTKLRHMAQLYAHVLYSDSLSWKTLSCIKLTEEDTSSASRIFLKYLLQELTEYMGLPKLNQRFSDATMQVYFSGLFPKDTTKNTRFAINFLTAIGCGGLTDDLRDHLKEAVRIAKEEKKKAMEKADSDSNSSSGSSSDSSSSSSGSGSSASDSSSSGSDSDTDESDSKSPARRRRRASSGMNEGVKPRRRSASESESERETKISVDGQQNASISRAAYSNRSSHKQRPRESLTPSPKANRRYRNTNGVSERGHERSFSPPSPRSRRRPYSRSRSPSSPCRPREPGHSDYRRKSSSPSPTRQKKRNNGSPAAPRRASEKEPEEMRQRTPLRISEREEPTHGQRNSRSPCLPAPRSSGGRLETHIGKESPREEDDIDVTSADEWESICGGKNSRRLRSVAIRKESL
eukprot:Nk52_evm34s2462 gene=Nk52_evmTU34s2462